VARSATQRLDPEPLRGPTGGLAAAAIAQFESVDKLLDDFERDIEQWGAP